MKNNFKRILSPKGLEIVFKNHGGSGNRIQLLRSVRNQNKMYSETHPVSLFAITQNALVKKN